MAKYVKNRQYGYFVPQDKIEAQVQMLDHQQIAGYSVGIIYIEDVYYPFVPGNVVNAYSYDFPVRMRGVPGLDIDRLFAADDSIADDIIKLGEHMIQYEGIRALCSACGFFGNFHSEVAEALDIRLPSDLEYDTLGGLVFSRLTEIPSDGKHPVVECFGLRISVEQIADRRVEWAIVEKIDPQSESEGADSNEGAHN